MGTYVLKLYWLLVRYELPILNYYLLCYFNTKILLLNRIITLSLSGNHECNTRNKDTINADPPDFLSALSKAESNLMLNITNLKDGVINLKDIIITNIQDENSVLNKLTASLNSVFQQFLNKQSTIN